MVSRSISSADDDQQSVARKARSSPPDEKAEEDGAVRLKSWLGYRRRGSYRS